MDGIAFMESIQALSKMMLNGQGSSIKHKRMKMVTNSVVTKSVISPKELILNSLNSMRIPLGE